MFRRLAIRQLLIITLSSHTLIVYSQDGKHEKNISHKGEVVEVGEHETPKSGEDHKAVRGSSERPDKEQNREANTKPSISPNQPADATVFGLKRIQSLRLTKRSLQVLKIWDLISPPGKPVDGLKKVYGVFNDDWKKAVEEVQALNEAEKKILNTILNDIEFAVDQELSEARKTNAPNKDQIYKEWKMWNDLNQGSQYEAPKATSNSSSGFGSVSRSDPKFSLTTEVYELSFLDPDDNVGISPNGKSGVYINENGNEIIYSNDDGIYVYPSFKFRNVPCYGISIDIKVSIRLNVFGGPPPQYKNQRMNGVKVEGEKFLLTKNSGLTCPTFLYNGVSEPGFFLHFKDEELRIPPGEHDISIIYEIFLEGVNVEKSKPTSITYNKL